MKNEVILASASPRRQELLKNIFDEFKIVPADIDENISEKIDAELRPEKIAEKKAAHIAKQYPESLVIGCDTAVICDREMLGKPKDKADAERMLRMLSGRSHKVITGNCLIFREKKLCFSVVTEVVFYPLSDSDIDSYLATDEWKDKAGAYGIQGKAGLFVEKINGDYNNVVGLPCAELNRKIKEMY